MHLLQECLHKLFEVLRIGLVPQSFLVALNDGLQLLFVTGLGELRPRHRENNHSDIKTRPRSGKQ